MKMLPLLLALSVFVSGPEFSSADTIPRLHLDVDTLVVQSKGESNSYPLSLIKENDTVRVWDIDSLRLLSGIDSITVIKTAEYMPVVLESPTTTRHLTVWFFDSEKQGGVILQERLSLLRKYPDYGATPAADFENFSYEPADDSNLVRLRETYNLDSIAGDGSEIERITNLLGWAHRAVRHDGNSYNPTPCNAMRILQVCADSGRGVNCRMMATLLNEVYLSEGFKSRHLTCLPGDTTDTECHVINMVYSDSLGKWLYMDPTNNAWFRNTDGALLSPAEVRQAMIDGDSLVLNEGADYNGSPLSYSQYTTYMAKNLFWFSTPIRSAFGYESRKGDRAWVDLYPEGYKAQLAGTADTTSGGSGEKITYRTDNDGWFWEK
jgi:hypothetical protein